MSPGCSSRSFMNRFELTNASVRLLAISDGALAQSRIHWPTVRTKRPVAMANTRRM